MMEIEIEETIFNGNTIGFHLNISGVMSIRRVREVCSYISGIEFFKGVFNPNKDISEYTTFLQCDYGRFAGKWYFSMPLRKRGYALMMSRQHSKDGAIYKITQPIY